MKLTTCDACEKNIPRAEVVVSIAEGDFCASCATAWDTARKAIEARHIPTMQAELDAALVALKTDKKPKKL